MKLIWDSNSDVEMSIALVALVIMVASSLLFS